MRLGKRPENRDILVLTAIILLGICLGYFFNNFIDNFRTYPFLDSDILYVLTLLAGFQLGACVGLIINPRTRIGGIFILSIALVVLVRWHTFAFIYFSDFVIAIFISVSLSMLAKARFIEKAPTHISMVTLNFLFLILFYYIYKLSQSDMSVVIVVLAAIVSFFVWMGCISIIKGGLE